MAVFYVVILIALLTFVVLGRNFFDLKKHDEGTEEMQDLAKIIRDGAKTFLRREYRVIAPTVAVVAVIYLFLMDG